jgi:predicted TIM-barrel fold metal-dependent hydrolase
MPFLTERFLTREAGMKDREQRFPRGVMYELRKFHYDVAQVTHPAALGSLLQLVPVSQVLFGTDSLIRSSEEHAKALAAYGFGASDLLAVERENARRLLPQLRKA